MSEDLIRALHPPRLPETFAAPGYADFLAAFGLGLLLAALILTLAMPFLRRRTPAPGWRARLAEAELLPAPERNIALAGILRDRGQSLPPEIAGALYSRQGVAPEEIEALIRQAGRSARRAKTAPAEGVPP